MDKNKVVGRTNRDLEMISMYVVNNHPQLYGHSMGSQNTSIEKNIIIQQILELPYSAPYLVVAITGLSDIEEISEVLYSSAKGFFETTCDKKRREKKIVRTAAARHARLEKTERQYVTQKLNQGVRAMVLELREKGFSYGEIAGRITISKSTVHSIVGTSNCQKY